MAPAVANGSPAPDRARAPARRSAAATNWASGLTVVSSGKVWVRVGGRSAGHTAAAGQRCGLDDVVDEAVLQRLSGREPVVPVVVTHDRLDGLARLLGGQLGQHLLHVHDELRT